jgi:hypothetical protein
MLMLLMVFGEVDLIRSQNHVCFLLFHMSMRIAYSERYKKLIRDIKTLEASNNSNTLSENTLPENEFETILLDDEGTTTIGALVRKEARLAYNLMSAMFDPNKRNDQFFDWEDLNDLCWTPGFVNNFLKFEDENQLFSIDGFTKAFQLDNYPLLKKLLNMSQEEAAQYSKADEVGPKIENEKYWFGNKWKTYFDRAGGWLGWRGYLTYFLNWSSPVYFQLFCYAVALGWMFGFQFTGGILNYVFAGITAFPLVCMVVYFILKHVFLRW